MVIKAARRQKLRMIVPNAGDQPVDVLVLEGDDIMMLTLSMAERYQLSATQQQKIFEYLVSTCS